MRLKKHMTNLNDDQTYGQDMLNAIDKEAVILADLAASWTGLSNQKRVTW